jgi:hypothetical protein
MRGAIPPLPQYVFIAWCSVKHRNNFTFTVQSNLSVSREETGIQKIVDLNGSKHTPYLKGKGKGKVPVLN